MEYNHLWVLILLHICMTKKEYILAVIDAMPDWEMWWWIKAMVQNDQLEDETIDKIVIIFKKLMNKISTMIKDGKLIETIEAEANLNKQKEEQEKQDAESLSKLDSMLNDF